MNRRHLPYFVASLLCPFLFIGAALLLPNPAPPPDCCPYCGNPIPPETARLAASHYHSEQSRSDRGNP